MSGFFHKCKVHSFVHRILIFLNSLIKLGKQDCKEGRKIMLSYTTFGKITSSTLLR